MINHFYNSEQPEVASDKVEGHPSFYFTCESRSLIDWAQEIDSAVKTNTFSQQNVHSFFSFFFF
jgi:hypothetical protein